MAVDTLPKLLRRNYKRWGAKKIAMRDKDRGIWIGYTWEDYYEKSKQFFYGLVSSGFESGDKLAIIGDAKPQAFWGELGALAKGGIVLGIFTDCTPGEVKYYVEHSDAKFVLAHDQEQVDKLLKVKDETPELKKVIYWDPKGLWFYDDPILISFDEVLELGREYEKERPGLFEQELERGKGEDVALLLYTSGTTGVPKGAMISQAALMSSYGQEVIERMGFDEKDEWVAFMALAWVGGQGWDVTTTLVSGMTVNFPEGSETVMENIREIGPAGLVFVPTQWENISRTIQAKMIDAHPMKQFFYQLFLPVCYKITDMRLNQVKLNLFWGALHLLAHLIVFRPLLDKQGLLKIKACLTGGSIVSPDMLRLMHGIGINVMQAYGGSDYGAITSLHQTGDVKWETSGPPLRGKNIRVTEEGEFMVKSDEKWLYGYYKDPELVRQSMEGGWFYTGDAGFIRDDGHVIVMDRVKDLKKLKGGQRFSPQHIEARLRFSPFIKNALAIGGADRDYVGLIANIDIENVGRWAEKGHIAYTTFTDLSQKPEVIELIGNEIRKVNRNLPEGARVMKFVSLHKELDPDEAELTRTRKLRRVFLEERYGDVVDALYSGKEEFEVGLPVTYQDGRKGVIRGSIKVTPVD